MVNPWRHIAAGYALSCMWMATLLAQYDENPPTSYVPSAGGGVPYRCVECGRVGLAHYRKPKCSGLPSDRHDPSPMMRQSSTTTGVEPLLIIE